jgi:hypothetical protein
MIGVDGGMMGGEMVGSIGICGKQAVSTIITNMPTEKVCICFFLGLRNGRTNNRFLYENIYYPVVKRVKFL